jgi:hypothetical protein
MGKKICLSVFLTAIIGLSGMIRLNAQSEEPYNAMEFIAAVQSDSGTRLVKMILFAFPEDMTVSAKDVIRLMDDYGYRPADALELSHFSENVVKSQRPLPVISLAPVLDAKGLINSAYLDGDSIFKFCRQKKILGLKFNQNFSGASGVFLGISKTALGSIGVKMSRVVAADNSVTIFMSFKTNVTGEAALTLIMLAGYESAGSEKLKDFYDSNSSVLTKDLKSGEELFFLGIGLIDINDSDETVFPILRVNKDGGQLFAAPFDAIYGSKARFIIQRPVIYEE